MSTWLGKQGDSGGVGGRSGCRRVAPIEGRWRVPKSEEHWLWWLADWVGAGPVADHKRIAALHENKLHGVSMSGDAGKCSIVA